ncbi:MAG: hypothetical protein WD845_16895 [Pirellulales bacterium]
MAIFVSLLIVVLATLAAGSTFVAMRATKAREQADVDFARATKAIDDMVEATAGREELKDFKMTKTRDALLAPAMVYYESYTQAHASDEVPPLAAAAAQFRIAGLHAKMGSNKSVPALGAGMRVIDKLRAAKVDPETYPSMQECAMGIAAPEEWIMLKGASMKEMQAHGGKLMMGLNTAITQYMHVNRDFPAARGPRSELATALGYSGALQARVGRRKEGLGQLRQARMHLESLLTDDPANSDYQTRLADLCFTMGGVEKAMKETEGATASYQKAVELREALSAANPDDKALAAQLAAAKKELDAIKSAAPAKVAAAPESAEAPPADAAAAEEPPAETKADAETKPAADADTEQPTTEPAGDAPAEPADDPPATP